MVMVVVGVLVVVKFRVAVEVDTGNKVTVEL